MKAWIYIIAIGLVCSGFVYDRKTYGDVRESLGIQTTLKIQATTDKNYAVEQIARTNDINEKLMADAPKILDSADTSLTGPAIAAWMPASPLPTRKPQLPSKAP